MALKHQIKGNQKRDTCDCAPLTSFSSSKV